jgi:hypothetical protein
MPHFHARWTILLGIAAIPSAHSQANAPLPTAEAVLDRFVAVSGGQTAYDRVENEIRTMTAKISGSSIAQIVIYRTRSGNVHEIARGAGGQSEIGVKDGIAWSRNGDVGHILEDGEEHAQALQLAQVLPDGHWRQYYKSAETVARDTVEGKPCYMLKVVPFAGGAHTLWFDQDTGLQVKQVEPRPAGGGEEEETAQEYFEAGGIKIPRILLARMDGVEVTFVVDDVKFNQSIPVSIFALPPDIERLMKKRFVEK